MPTTSSRLVAVGDGGDADGDGGVASTIDGNQCSSLPPANGSETVGSLDAAPAGRPLE